MKAYVYAALFCCLFIVAGCASNAAPNDDSKSGGEEVSLEPPKVEVMIQPERPQPNEKTLIQAKVTHADEAVNDASITFEIKTEGKDPVKKEAARTGEGLYEIEYTFDDAGQYIVIPHTDANGMHVMFDHPVTVGDPPPEEEKQGAAGEHEDEAHSSEHSQIHIEVPEEWKAQTPATVKVHVHRDGKPLQEASVRLEIWKDGNEKHQYMDTDESAPGEYRREVTLEEAGKYHVNVHVEKGDFHDHKETAISVQ